MTHTLSSVLPGLFQRLAKATRPCMAQNARQKHIGHFQPKRSKTLLWLQRIPLADKKENLILRALSDEPFQDPDTAGLHAQKQIADTREAVALY